MFFLLKLYKVEVRECGRLDLDSLREQPHANRGKKHCRIARRARTEYHVIDSTVS